ncbi:MAG: hypothetical protein QOI70_95 [Microbacteriaceae bacterium]|nr:hypothetical protein [Microbacteriaceae bacterium]
MTKNGRKQPSTPVGEALAVTPQRTIETWAERRVGKPIDEIKTSDVLRRIPHATGLRYAPRSATSPLGGRIASHLRHLEEAEIIERLERAETFLAETPVVTGPAKDPASAEDEAGREADGGGRVTTLAP